MKLSNQNICNLRGGQMPLGGAKKKLFLVTEIKTPQTQST